MASSKTLSIVDSIIVLLNIATGKGCVLLFLLFSQVSSLYTYAIIVIIDLLYILLRFSTGRTKNYRLYDFKFFYVIMGLQFYNVLNCIRTGEEFITPFFYILQVCLFVFILYKLYCYYLSDKHTLLQLCKGYFWLASLSVLGMIISFVLASNGIMYERQLPAMDFLESNEAGGLKYMWVNLTMLDPSPLRVPIFQEYGMFTGLYHEPHVLTYMVFPFFMLCIGYIKKNIQAVLLLLVSLLIVLLSGSFTNIAVLLLCFVIYSAFNFKGSFWTILLIIVAILIPAYHFILSNDIFLLFLQGRMEVGNDSQDFSLKLLEFMFYPKTILGTNFLSSKYVLSSSGAENIGWIPFFINIAILLEYIRNTYKLFKAGNKFALSVAMASTYFILHSAKMGMLLYQQSLFYFLFFLQLVTIQLYGRVSITSKNILQRAGA